MTDEVKTRLYFMVHGLEIDDPKALEAAMQEAILRMSGVRALTGSEEALLREGGLNPAPETGPDPLTETLTAFNALLKDSIDTAEAATRLNVHVSRIRRMLTRDATLYGFQIEGRWRIPRYQFTDDGLIPGVGQVNAVLDRALHPVAVHRWFNSPAADLDVEGVPVSPLDWLKAGHSVETVRRIAASL